MGSDDVPESNENEYDRIGRRRFIAAAGAGAAGVGLAGCAGGDGSQTTAADTDAGAGGTTDTRTTASSDEIQEGGRLIWAHSEQVVGNDIHKTAGESSYRVLSNVHENIIGLTSELNISTEKDIAQPGLAKNLEVGDDIRTYTFELREGIMSHGGTELTAEDVEYTFQRIKDPDNGANNQFIFKKIESMEVIDDYTFQFTLGNRFRRFIAQLAFYSSAIIPKGTGPQQEDNPVGFGPFTWEERNVGENIVLQKFDDYWGTGPYIDTLEQRTATDPNARLTSVQTGDADFTDLVPLPQTNEVVNNTEDDVKTKTWSPLSVAFIMHNTTQEPFDDTAFRQATAYAIDKQQLVEGAIYGFGSPTESGILPPSKFRNTELERRGQDLEMARQKYSESKYDPADYELEFLVSPNYPWHVEAAKIIQQFLSQAGLSVTITQLQWGEYLKQVLGLNYSISLVNWFRGWDPAYWLRNVFFSDGAYNLFGFANEEFDRAMDNAATADTQEESIRFYKEAQAIRHEQAPAINVWFRNGAMAAKPETRGLATAPLPGGSLFRFEEFWLDE